MGKQKEYAVDMQGITKRFGEVLANKNVNLQLEKGEILAILGENGSGKTTLMNMLSGIYYPDDGQIKIHGNAVTIKSPKEAFDYGIGMIHQHFKLVDIMTAAENIILGLNKGFKLNRKALNKEVKELSEKYGFDINPEKKIYDMSVSEKQTVEILKVLYRGADILILDEPTAVLTPQESNKLFAVMKNMSKHGKSIIIITHKLQEVLSVSDRVSILRKGEYIGTVITKNVNKEMLTEMMVGHAINLEINRPKVKRGDKLLKITNLSCKNSEGVEGLKNINLSAYAGEVLGIAGIAGSGQRELCESIAGLIEVSEGSIQIHTAKSGNVMAEIVGKAPEDIFEMGVSMAFVPEDRLGMGLVASMGMVDNILVRYYRENKGIFINRKKPELLSRELVEELEIVTPDVTTPVKNLSGGNVQKILIGREISSAPEVLIVAYPVRGLDINSAYKIYDLINEQKQKGVAVIFVGEDLDILMEISDRVAVMCGGKISGIVYPEDVTREDIGLMMIGESIDKEEAI